MSRTYAITRSIVYGLFRLFYRLEVEGEEHLHREGGALIAASHASFLDPPLVAASSAVQLHFLARESLFETPLFGALIAKLNAHPVKGDSTLKSLRTIVGLIQEGDKVLIFPEGHRSPDGELRALEPGTALITAKAGCPIIPCHIEGAFAVWPRHKRWPLPWGRIHVRFGAPLKWEQFKDLDKKNQRQAILNELEASLRALRG